MILKFIVILTAAVIFAYFANLAFLGQL